MTQVAEPGGTRIMRAYLGAATTGQGSPAEGVTIADIDGRHITPRGTGVHGVVNPMYLALSPAGDVLYVTHERDQGRVSAWRPVGDRLEPIGEAQSSGGDGPCHLSVHPGGAHVLVANYVSGTVAALPILADGLAAGAVGAPTSVIQHEGSGPLSARQASAHAHMIVTDGPTVLAVDLGTDSIHRYAFDEAAGTLSAIEPIRLPPGAGPRHLAIAGRRAFVADELDSTLSVVDLDAGRVVSTVSTLPPGEVATSAPSAIRLSADARFVYVANRGPDTIAVLTADDDEPRLVHTVPTGGVHPRDLTFSPDGGHLYVANQFSDAITVFTVDAASGLPVPVGEPFVTPSPSCILFAG